MYRAVYAVAAEMALVDKNTNEFSLINIRDDVTASSLPVVVPRFAFVFVFEKQPSEPAVTSAALKGWFGDRELFSSELSVDFGAAPRTRAIVAVEGLRFESAGTLTVECSMGSAVAHLEVPIIDHAAPRARARVAPAKRTVAKRPRMP